MATNIQINDAILLATKAPDVSTGLSQWYSRADDEHVSDAEYRWLGEQAGVTALSRTDRWWQFLTGLGYTGGMMSMKLEFWQAQP